jgi:UDP-2-acetamido-2,6-beta-L-arabino-hexul-4-ose reductase
MTSEGNSAISVLVTGSNGFIGKNLRVALGRMPNINLKTFDVEDDWTTLEGHLREADVVFHLAGVNRPRLEEEFVEGNTELTRRIIEFLSLINRTPLIVISSSVQAEQDNPYGRSKLGAEQALLEYHRATNGRVCIYRLPNVFGKWSRPNYNTVVATFCYNVIHGLEVSISDPSKELELVYIDEVVREFISLLAEDPPEQALYRTVTRTFRVTLGTLSQKIRGFKEMRSNLLVPDLSDEFMRCLHATYLSFLDSKDFTYSLDVKHDNRGMLFELIKSESFGQIFVSTTRAGVTRGNHYHDSKIEKFCVIKGQAAIRFRQILTGETIDYTVSGQKVEVIDIPPGYTHHIENLSDDEMIVLFWANRIFDPASPDTFYCEV